MGLAILTPMISMKSPPKGSFLLRPGLESPEPVLFDCEYLPGTFHISKVSLLIIFNISLVSVMKKIACTEVEVEACASG